jgi:SPW repeat
MRKYLRWESAAAVAGLYAVLSPIWTDTTTRATWTMIVLGVLTIAGAGVALARPDMELSDGALAVLGVLFIISPWVMGFSGTTPMAVTAWVVGAITLVAGAVAWPESHRHHRGHMAPMH